MEVVWIGCALLFGWGAMKIGLPALVGFLFAGFALAVLEGPLSLPDTHTVALDHVAHLGVLLLLFTVGLKLNFKQVFKREVIGTGIMHMLLSVVIFTPIIYGVFDQPLSMSLMLAGALSFSSTVLAAKVLESKQELRAFHGRIAIGILIVQDLLAMTMLSLTSGETPPWYAVSVVLVPFIRPLVWKFLDHAGHGEMLPLAGLGLAVIGGGAFHAVGLSGELGALALGALCARHEKSGELYDSLWALKEVFLVGFFLTIGLKGLPTLDDFAFAGVMVALLPLQAVIFFGLLVSFRLKARSAFLTTSSLTTFSEFGLIVAAVAMPQWVVPLALCVAFSFVVAAPLNRFAHPLFDRYESLLKPFEREVEHPDEAPLSLGRTRILFMGMGQIGRASYRAARSRFQEEELLGLDSDADKIKRLDKKGYRATYADAEHGNFWSTVDTSQLDAVVLAMDCPEASLTVTKRLRQAGFSGQIVAHSKYEDEKRNLEKAGADLSYVTLDEAGQGLFANVLPGSSSLPQEEDEDETLQRSMDLQSTLTNRA